MASGDNGRVRDPYGDVLDEFRRDNLEEEVAEAREAAEDFPFGSGGLDPVQDVGLRAEARLQEYLFFNNGQVFSSDPVAGVGGEGRGWLKTGGHAVFADFHQREQLARYLYWLYTVADPTARNIVNIYSTFILGNGSTVSVHGARNKAKWDKLAASLRWELLERKLIKSTVLFGEVFALVFPKAHPAVKFDRARGEVDSRTMGEEGRAPGRRVSVLHAWDVEDVPCVKGDPDTPAAYLQRWAKGDGTSELVPHHPDDVEHFRLDPLPQVVRGLSVLLPVLQQLYYYRSFVTNRHWLNMIRPRVPLTITRKGGGTRELLAQKSKFRKLPPPGTVWHLPGNTQVDFPSLNIGAADAKDDGKQILHTIAMGVSLPFFLVANDASNANYSSTVVAESPAMRLFSDLQSMFACSFERLIARLLAIDVDKVEVRFPNVHRNLKQIVDARSIMYRDGVLSKRSYVESTGIPWDGPDGERARLEVEAGFQAEDPEATAPPGALAGNAGPGGKAGDAEPGQGRATPPGMGGGGGQ